MDPNEDNGNEEAYNLQAAAINNPSDAEFYTELEKMQVQQTTELKKLLSKILRMKYVANCAMLDMIKITGKAEKLNEAMEYYKNIDFNASGAREI